MFAKRQESVRKDIERAFGVLQERFAIIREPGRPWHVSTLSNIIKACIIMHNMIVEDEREGYSKQIPLDYDSCSFTVSPSIQHGGQMDEMMRRQRQKSILDKDAHNRLTKDLIENIWRFYAYGDDDDDE